MGERYSGTTLLTYAPQQWTFILPVPILILAAFRGRWKVVVANIGLVGFICFALMGFCWRGIIPKPVSRSRNTLRLMTFNIEHGNAGVRRVAQMVADVNPDIVCFNEVNAEKPGGIAPYTALRKALPGYTLTPENETVVASRLPWTNSRLLPPAGKGLERRSVLVEVNVHGMPFCVLATHLATSVTPETMGSHKGNLATYLQRTTRVREEQIDSLLAVVAARKTPIVVCGDFNTPPRGHVYERMTCAMTDAFAASGVGFGHTFSSTHPLIRIDYIFTNGVVVRTCRVVDANASDHRPVTADIDVSRVR